MSPSVQDYDIYADETYLHGPIAFAFGALICTPRRSEIFAEQISSLRKNSAILSEIKWKKTFRDNLPLRMALIDIFFDDKFVKFSVLQITKGVEWNVWAKTEEERFFKCYYVFLMRNAGPFSRYRVFLDEKSLQKPYRWETLHFLVNRSRRENWDLRRRNIRFLNPVDSKSSDLLQLTDLLLGCATSKAASEAKSTLKDHFQTRFSAAPERKLRLETWTPKRSPG